MRLKKLIIFLQLSTVADGHAHQALSAFQTWLEQKLSLVHGPIYPNR